MLQTHFYTRTQLAPYRTQHRVPVLQPHSAQLGRHLRRILLRRAAQRRRQSVRAEPTLARLDRRWQSAQASVTRLDRGWKLTEEISNHKPRNITRWLEIEFGNRTTKPRWIWVYGPTLSYRQPGRRSLSHPTALLTSALFLMGPEQKKNKQRTIIIIIWPGHFDTLSKSNNRFVKLKTLKIIYLCASFVPIGWKVDTHTHARVSFKRSPTQALLSLGKFSICWT